MLLRRSAADAVGPGREFIDLHADDPLSPQFGEHLFQKTFFRPSVHAGIDGVPVAETFRQSSPLAPAFGHVEYGVQKIQIAHLYVAALAGQQILDPLVLLRREFHVWDLSYMIDYAIALTFP